MTDIVLPLQHRESVHLTLSNIDIFVYLRNGVATLGIMEPGGPPEDLHTIKVDETDGTILAFHCNTGQEIEVLRDVPVECPEEAIRPAGAATPSEDDPCFICGDTFLEANSVGTCSCGCAYWTVSDTRLKGKQDG